MAEVHPFKGLRYNTRLVSDLTDILSPPFDTIPTDLQQALYRRNRYNMVRLEAGEQFDSDTAEDNRYTRAKNLLALWTRQNVLTQDSSPTFYLFRHGFTHLGRRHTRHGLIAAVRLEEYSKGIIIPHEHTGEADKKDRLSLMEACHANFSPVMSLYRDRDRFLSSILQQIEETEPIASGDGTDGQDFILWKANDPHQVNTIKEAMADKTLYIADGHHRYETALRFKELRQTASSSTSDVEPACNFVLMALIAFEDPGLMVLPYHRVVSGLTTHQVNQVWGNVKDRFDMLSLPAGTTVDTILQKLGKQRPEWKVLGVIGETTEESFILKLKPEHNLDSCGPTARAESWLLEELILRPALGPSLPQHLSYTHEAKELAFQARSGPGCMTFLLKPLRLDLFETIVGSGQRLPRKSTFFHPKLPSGLVINPLYN
jgi:uncharacterized protein (DUF1015 family)